MSVSERDSGIVSAHAEGIQSAARTNNTFIFVRPTEYDSTVLIRAGYATKSMDVHHKSSNWGPMAGFVPCDPAFSKKCEGAPNPEENEHKHGAAHPVHLGLKPSLVAEHEKIEMTDGYLLASEESADKRAIPWIVKRQTGGGAVAKARAKFDAFHAQGHLPEHKFCTAKPVGVGNWATLFCLIEKGGEWLVHWVRWDGAIGRLHPLRVFAYAQDGRLNPVTGDYDLWMMAPHFEHLGSHSVVNLVTDSHGSSAASSFTTTMIRRMNESCGRTSNPVFNHGAEAQNYGFTQALDWNLAMFTASGGSRMVRMNQMPGILADLHQAGYLVVWNKRYGEIDPHLMGSADRRAGPSIGEIRAELEGVYRELAEIRGEVASAPAKPRASSSSSKAAPSMSDLMKKEIEVMSRRFAASRKLGVEQSRIHRFHRKLLEFLDSKLQKFRVLTKGDFPASVRIQSDSNLRKLHLDLQKVLVASTKGSGESDEAPLRAWLASHKSEIDRLAKSWP